MADIIFMIHGMWGRSFLWDNYKAFFEDRGYVCTAPTLPLHDYLPTDPAPADLATTSLLDYAADLEAKIRALPQEPIIMGHSMGGLLAQMMAGRGLGKAAVFITPASPAGIMALRWPVIKTFKSVFFRWGFWKKPAMITFKEARDSMMLQLTPEEQHEAYGRFVYESGRAISEIGLWPFDCKGAAKVDETNIKCPVLVIGSGKDRITPVKVVRQVAVKYSATGTYKEFPEHAHWVLGEPGWQDVATYIDTWLTGMALPK